MARHATDELLTTLGVFSADDLSEPPHDVTSTMAEDGHTVLAPELVERSST